MSIKRSATHAGGEPAHDILKELHRPIDVFFSPSSVAVIGATDKVGSVGRTVLWNLMSTPFGGTIYPVNPKRTNVLGIKAYKTVAEIPERVDLAVIILPATSVPGVIRECAEAKVKGAVVISAGFKELGPSGAELERQVLVEARKGGMRVIGPNCLGVMAPLSGLNATFASSMARPGNVGFVSQSGALCTAVLDWSRKELVGFSAFISIGAMVDVDWGDMIQYLGDDPRTQSIVIYMESVGNARSFLSAAREVALTKPIIVIKAGRTEAAAKAAASHTGSLAGSDEVLDAAFRRCGVLRVNTIEDLFSMSAVLAKQPRPKGPKLLIVTNAGGPGVLATDAFVGAGGTLATLDPDTVKLLSAFLPPHWSRGNPLDILGDAGPDKYAKTMELMSKDPGSDGILVILTPQAMTDPTATAQAIVPYAKIDDKPVLASWMGGPDVAAGEAILTAANIPTFAAPDVAARAFRYMWEYSDNLNHIYETPQLPKEEAGVDRKGAAKIIAAAAAAGRSLLTEAEAKDLLATYGIPVARTIVATTPDAAVAAAEKIGYPVVLKLNSETVTHKTDVGGVQLNLVTPEGVRRAWDAIEAGVTAKAGKAAFQGVTVQPHVRMEGYEIILGSSVDSQFGPVVLFGTGGQLVEVFRDRALGLPPLTTTLARQMMTQTRIFSAFKGVRGRKPVDLPALEQLMVMFSHLVVENRRIKEIDVNPLLVSADGIVALDARVLLHPADVADKDLPQPAIRPYPIEYQWDFELKGGHKSLIRPIRPEDEPLMVDFHRRLSELSVYHRYFGNVPLADRVRHERLTRICFLDYDRQMVLVAEEKTAKGERQIVAVGRLGRTAAEGEAEFALLIIDQYQGSGLGTALLERLIEVARAEGIKRLTAEMLADNVAMRRLAEQLGFKPIASDDATIMRCALDLQG
ncbi:MAG: bifunctional acetate--CoA ligase family protein/GNAT family N-acetyltransferase [Candidatus Coatesbacteria bacterium]